MIKIVGNDIMSGGQKLGWFEGNHILDRTGRTLGYFADNDIYDASGQKIAYIEDERVRTMVGQEIRLSEIRKDVKGGQDDIAIAAVRLLLGE